MRSQTAHRRPGGSRSAWALLSPRARERALEVKRDPRRFGELVLEPAGELGYTAQQLEVLLAARDHDRVAVPSGHGCGKTFVAADLVLWWLHTRVPSKVITLAPTREQVEDVLWSEIRRRHAMARVDLGSEVLPRAPFIAVGEEHFAKGISTNEPGRMQGYHSPHLLVVVDEAQALRADLWTAVRGLQPEKLILLGNPVGSSDEFHRACQRLDYRVMRLDCLDHPNVRSGRELYPGMVTREWVDECKRDWGEDSPMFMARVRGRFPPASPDTLIPLDQVERAVGREVEPSENTVIACDVARYGDSETVITVLRGGRQLLERTWVGQDLMRTTGEIVRTLKRAGARARIVVDDDGVGGGVTDRLAELGHDVLPFRAGEKPADREHFQNLRSEAWWALRDAFREGRISILKDQKLHAQLSSLSYKPRSDGRIEVESKESLRTKKKLPSPDRADALMMAWWGLGRSRIMSIARQDPPESPEDWRREFDHLSGIGGRHEIHR